MLGSDKVSRDVTARAWGDEVDVESSAKPQHSMMATMAKVDLSTNSDLPATGYKSRGTTQDMNLLKQQLVDRAREAGFNIDSNVFPWKTLLELLAKNGFYLKDWPHDSRALGDVVILLVSKFCSRV